MQNLVKQEYIFLYISELSYKVEKEGRRMFRGKIRDFKIMKGSGKYGKEVRMDESKWELMKGSGKVEMESDDG